MFDAVVFKLECPAGVTMGEFTLLVAEGLKELTTIAERVAAKRRARGLIPCEEEQDTNESDETTILVVRRIPDTPASTSEGIPAF